MRRNCRFQEFAGFPRALLPEYYFVATKGFFVCHVEHDATDAVPMSERLPKNGGLAYITEVVAPRPGVFLRDEI
jgi:hypothetical protein